jgi:hypothetical protein
LKDKGLPTAKKKARRVKEAPDALDATGNYGIK